MKEFAKNRQFQLINDFNTAIADGKFPVSGSFVAANPHLWWVFLVKIGTLDSALTLQVYQDTGVTQTASVKVITGATVVIAADDDNELAIIEFCVKDAMDVGNDFSHFSLDISGAAGSNDYLDILLLGCHAKSMPVTHPATVTKVVVAG